MARVFITASYKGPRKFNWVVGVFLFLLTLGLSFTGRLLPWDQLTYWAITPGPDIARYTPLVGSQLRILLLGGHTIGATVGISGRRRTGGDPRYAGQP
jgi:quinol-cytochrome oxidoreductase complex cytochrome b subunit